MARFIKPNSLALTGLSADETRPFSLRLYDTRLSADETRPFSLPSLSLHLNINLWSLWSLWRSRHTTTKIAPLNIKSR